MYTYEFLHSLCNFFLHFKRNPIVIHSSIETDRAKIYTIVYQLVETFSNVRKITDCTKNKTWWCQTQILIYEDFAISFIQRSDVHEQQSTYFYLLLLINSIVYYNKCAIKCCLWLFMQNMKVAIIWEKIHNLLVNVGYVLFLQCRYLHSRMNYQRKHSIV